MDIVSKLEGMGDFIINVSQSLERAFAGKWPHFFRENVH
jgi:hypothetical protein